MNDRRSFEQMLACYCAPVLKKHKAANMFHMDKAKNLFIFALIREYNEKLSRKQIQIKVLQPANSRITIFVFQTKKLQQILKRKDVMLFLQSFGYPLPCSLQTLFAHLEQRLSMASAYPHEIGVLLGYPLHDVVGFIEQRECLLQGHWNVYRHPRKAMQMFSLFERCSKELMCGVRHGIPIEQLI